MNWLPGWWCWTGILLVPDDSIGLRQGHGAPCPYGGLGLALGRISGYWLLLDVLIFKVIRCRCYEKSHRRRLAGEKKRLTDLIAYDC